MNYIDLATNLIEFESTARRPESLQSIIDYSIDYIATNSPTNCRLFESHGIPSALFYNGTEFPQSFRLILNAHLDVVDGSQSQFEPHREGNKLFGRGAYDMKCAAAVLMNLFCELSERVDYPLGLQLVTDEESTGIHGVAHQVGEGVRSDFVVIGEYTNLKINFESKGVCRISIKAQGAHGHSAYPWESLNALDELLAVLNKIKQNHPINDDSSETTWTLTRLHCPNQADNQIPDYAEAVVDIRFNPTEELFDEQEDYKKLREYLQSYETGNVEIVAKNIDPPQYTSVDHPDAQLLAGIIESRLNRQAEFISMNGTSDMRYYNQVGCDGVCFGISGGNPHADGEWADLDSLETYYLVMKDFILSLSSE